MQLVDLDLCGHQSLDSKDIPILVYLAGIMRPRSKRRILVCIGGY